MDASIDTGLLAEAIWEEARTKYTRDINDWDTLEVVVVQGLEGWPEDDLIKEAEELGIDIDEYKEGDDA